MYEVGELVRILPNANELQPDKSGLRLDSYGYMLKYLGQTFQVSDVVLTHAVPRYRLEGAEDEDIQWVWSEEWLEPAEDTSELQEELSNFLTEILGE